MDALGDRRGPGWNLGCAHGGRGRQRLVRPVAHPFGMNCLDCQNALPFETRLYVYREAG